MSNNWKPEFKKSTKDFKKYMVVTPKGRTVHFGDKRYQHYRDTTGKGLYSHLDHNNPKRRQLYRIRHRAIKTKEGRPAYKDKEQSSYYSYNYLW
jgi:hypothetical protein